MAKEITKLIMMVQGDDDQSVVPLTVGCYYEVTNGEELYNRTLQCTIENFQTQTVDAIYADVLQSAKDHEGIS